MAACSLSTGRSGTRCSAQSWQMRLPATTKVSLLARAMALPARMALTVGRKPAKPTMAVSTMSISAFATTWQRASLPQNTLMGRWAKASRTKSYWPSSAITTVSGLNCRACCTSSLALLPAVRVWAAKWSGCCEITSRACVPIDPVEPSMAICFIRLWES